MKIIFSALTFFFLVANLRSAEPEVIPIQVRENLRIVYQVTDDAIYEHMNKGLFYARKLINTYEKHGIAADQIHLHLVYHGTGIAAVVNDEARKRLGAETANPNGEVLAELIRRGVQIRTPSDPGPSAGREPRG